MNKQKSKSEVKKMFNLYKINKNLEIVGKKVGLTRERVRQILTKHYGEKYFEIKINKYKCEKKCKNCDKVIGTRRYIQKKYCSLKCLKEFNQKTRNKLKEKLCSKCKEIKSINNFFKYSYNNRFYPHCKKCHKKYVLSWRKRNPEKAKIIDNRAARKWVKKNPEKARKNNRQHYKRFIYRFKHDKKFRDKMRKYRRDYYRQHYSKNF